MTTLFQLAPNDPFAPSFFACHIEFGGRVLSLAGRLGLQWPSPAAASAPPPPPPAPPPPPPQAYKGPSTSHVLHGLQPSSDYRFRVCAIRQCADAPELSGPYSPTVTLSPPRGEAQGGGAGGGGLGAAGAGLRAGGAESARPRRSLSDEQCAFLLLMAFAVIAILIAFVIQYFVIK